MEVNRKQAREFLERIGCKAMRLPMKGRELLICGPGLKPFKITALESGDFRVELLSEEKGNG